MGGMHWMPMPTFHVCIYNNYQGYKTGDAEMLWEWIACIEFAHFNGIRCFFLRHASKSRSAIYFRCFFSASMYFFASEALKIFHPDAPSSEIGYFLHRKR